jgi:hypothetical protein
MMLSLVNKMEVVKTPDLNLVFGITSLVDLCAVVVTENLSLIFAKLEGEFLESFRGLLGQNLVVIFR